MELMLLSNCRYRRDTSVFSESSLSACTEEQGAHGQECVRMKYSRHGQDGSERTCGVCHDATALCDSDEAGD